MNKELGIGNWELGIKKRPRASQGFIQPHFSSKDGAGFSVVELLIVMTVIALLAGPLAINLIGFRQQRSLQNDTRLVVGMLRDAQQRSLTQEGDMTWGVSVAPDGLYSIYSYAPNVISWSRHLGPGIIFVEPGSPDPLASELFFNFEALTGVLVGGVSQDVRVCMNDSMANDCWRITVEPAGAITYIEE
jgi:type II secretory pathway pseudopilin PulG